VPDPPLPYRVTATRRDTHDTCTLRLEPRRSPTAPFAPGQFAMLYAFGAGEAPISLAARDGDALVHTIRAVGAVTARLCAMKPGDTVGVRGPFGRGWPLEAAEGRDLVLIAGGLGLPPLRPVVEAVLAQRERYGAVAVLYGGRSPAELLYGDDLARWGGRGDVSVDVTVDAADRGWQGRVGVVTRLIAAAPVDPARTVAMVCGPEVMMRFCAAELRARGVAPDAIWLSLERGMTCGTGHCGHCQLGPLFICLDGPVLRHDVVEPLMRVAEL